MDVEIVYEDVRYRLSNKNLKVGDLVYPITNGRTLDDGEYLLHNIDSRDFMSGFPTEPHTILDLNHSDYKPYEIRTDKGYGPVDQYYTIIKKEIQIPENPNALFKRSVWVEF
jgi:hypothetical protein